MAKEELSRECDYRLEAANQKRFRDLLAGVDGFYVPIVVDTISSKRVLTTELVYGNYKNFNHFFLMHFSIHLYMQFSGTITCIACSHT